MVQRSVAQDPEQCSRRGVVDFLLPERRGFRHAADAIPPVTRGAFAGKQFRSRLLRAFLSIQRVTHYRGGSPCVLHQVFTSHTCDGRQQAST